MAATRRASGWWTEHVVPRCVDLSLGSAQVAALRVEVCRGLAGKVLEIGFGSGLNLPHYPAAVDSVDAVEPSALAWSRSAGRRANAPFPVARVGLDGAALDAGDATYDAVLCTFTLCTVADVEAALAEVRRVLVPGGALHFVEHGLAPDERVARWQRRLEPVQRRIAGGCHLTRDPVVLAAAEGLEIESVETAYLPGPAITRPWSYGYLGRALAPGLAA